MNIKSFLIGSAATLVVASGAQAADAIVAPEPESVEYVRVCDAYGAGFFYIPGTETCLKIGGMVRYQIGANQSFKGDNGNRADRGWNKYARMELNLDARSETELGTLRSYIKLRGSSSNSTATVWYDADGDKHAHSGSGAAGTVGVQQAYIGLGGLEMGLADTLYDADLSGEFDSGGGDRVHFMRYTFAGSNGFSATLALEEADKEYDYVPNVVGRIGVTQGWGAANAYVAYDATAEEWAGKIIASVNVTDAIWVEGIATYESGANYYGVINTKDFAGSAGTGPNYNLGAKWSAGGLVGYRFNDKLKASIGAQYFDKVAHIDGINAWSAGLTADYKIVQGFDAKLAVNYTQVKFDDEKNNAWGGFLRLQRNF